MGTRRSRRVWIVLLENPRRGRRSPKKQPDVKLCGCEAIVAPPRLETPVSRGGGALMNIIRFFRFAAGACLAASSAVVGAADEQRKREASQPAKQGGRAADAK